MEILKALKNIELFKNLNDCELNEIKKFMSDIKYYPSRTTIFNVGDKINNFGILLSGQIELAIDDDFGNKTILSKLSAPALFAESVLIQNIEEIPLSVESTVYTEVIFFDYNSFKESSSISKEKVNDNLIKILANKNLFMRDKLNLLSLPSTRAKILYFLSNESRKNHSKYFIIEIK